MGSQKLAGTAPKNGTLESSGQFNINNCVDNYT